MLTIFPRALDDVLHHVSAFMAAHIPNYDSSSPERPASISKAMQSPHFSEWIKALMTELMSMVSHDVWDSVPVDLPEGATAVNPLLVLTTKSEFGKLTRYKARLCAQGQSQVLGVDCVTFSPVIKHSSFRIILAIAQLL